ncbi:MAG: pyridoxamine 5'-phosphate oxidase family protein [Rickettsiales bacterium]|jgi:general stress protein 26|nr:pyridoxamine 5'-phosphate oxidase family protein [Rickettsiales bacterium]
MNDTEKILANIIENQPLCTVASIDEYGIPHIRSMQSPRIRNGLKEFYLTTNTSSEKVGMFKKNPNACIYFLKAAAFQGFELSGKMEILEDKNMRKAMWRKGDEIYYHDGVDDPDYCVLKFTAKNGKYYHDLTVEKFKP